MFKYVVMAVSVYLIGVVPGCKTAAWPGGAEVLARWPSEVAGEAVRSCSVPGSPGAGKEIVTIEGESYRLKEAKEHQQRQAASTS